MNMLSRLIFFVFCLISFQVAFAEINVFDLTVDYQKKPLGIASASPKLSWKIQNNDNGTSQTAYRILVASKKSLLQEGKADVWDSRKVNSDQSIQVNYQGKRLESRQRYFWKVKVWDQEGKAGSYSPIDWWEMALLDADDWQAKWIRHPDQVDNELLAKPAPFFRKSFSATKPITSARAFVTGLGYFEMYLNGQKVSDHILDPVKTRYDKTVKYLVHDITDLVKEGENAVGMVLGTGWFNHFAKAAWQFDQAPWRAYPTMICQLEITYQDGSRQVVISDDSWKSSSGPIIFDGIRNGETYDSRKEMPGWSRSGFNDERWQAAKVVDGPSGKLLPQFIPAIKEMQIVKPVSVTEIKPGVYVFDLGQNISGYSRIEVAGPAGTEITLKHGERLFPDGAVEQKQILRFLKTGEAQTDHYILKGEGLETWSPRFVYHGYQYVEVSGLPAPPTLEMLKGIVIHTSFESAGNFACSNPLFNRIQELTRWSYIGNYHGIPTDCPHREKIGWSGDGLLVAEAGLFNYDTETAYIKWMDDFVDEQQADGNLPGVVPTSGWGYEYGKNPKYRPLGYGPSWEGAMIVIPWQIYQFSADTSVLSRFYEPMKNYLGYLEKNAEDLLLNFGIDDHKSFYTHTGPEIIASGYYAYLTDMFADIAAILQKSGDHEHYSQMSQNIRKAFNEKYYNEEDASYGNGGQTSLSEALFMDLVPDGKELEVMNTLIENIEASKYHFDAGVVGVKFLFNVLTEYDKAEVIYQMANQKDFPSYGWWIEQGANTLWQDWDGSMSLNHIMFGTISEWFIEALAGINIDPGHPGFKNVIFQPRFVSDLDWASAEHESMYGTISSNWSRNGDEITLNLQVPANSTSSLILPANASGILMNGEARQAQQNSNGEHILQTGSGSYTVKFNYN